MSNAKPFDFSIERAVIVTRNKTELNLLNRESGTLPLETLVLEEDMFNGPMSGSLVFFDTGDMVEGAKIIGGEEVRFTFKNEISENGEEEVRKNLKFYVHSVIPADVAEAKNFKRYQIDFSSFESVYLNYGTTPILPDGSDFFGKISTTRDADEGLLTQVGEFLGLLEDEPKGIVNYLSKKYFDANEFGNSVKDADIEPTKNFVWFKKDHMLYPYRKPVQQMPLLQLMNHLAENSVHEKNDYAVNFLFWQDFDQWRFRSIEDLIDQQPEIPTYYMFEGARGEERREIVSMNVTKEFSPLEFLHSNSNVAEYLKVEPNYENAYQNFTSFYDSHKSTLIQYIYGDEYDKVKRIERYPLIDENIDDNIFQTFTKFVSGLFTEETIEPQIPHRIYDNIHGYFEPSYYNDPRIKHRHNQTDITKTYRSDMNHIGNTYGNGGEVLWQPMFDQTNLEGEPLRKILEIKRELAEKRAELAFKRDLKEKWTAYRCSVCCLGGFTEDLLYTEAEYEQLLEILDSLTLDENKKKLLEKTDLTDQYNIVAAGTASDIINYDSDPETRPPVANQNGFWLSYDLDELGEEEYGASALASVGMSKTMQEIYGLRDVGSIESWDFQIDASIWTLEQWLPRMEAVYNQCSSNPCPPNTTRVLKIAKNAVVEQSWSTQIEVPDYGTIPPSLKTETVYGGVRSDGTYYNREYLDKLAFSDQDFGFYQGAIRQFGYEGPGTRPLESIDGGQYGPYYADAIEIVDRDTNPANQWKDVSQPGEPGPRFGWSPSDEWIGVGYVAATWSIQSTGSEYAYPGESNFWPCMYFSPSLITTFDQFDPFLNTVIGDRGQDSSENQSNFRRYVINRETVIGDNPLDQGDVEAEVGSATYRYREANSATTIINAFGGCSIGSLDYEISIAPGPSGWAITCCPGYDSADFDINNPPDPCPCPPARVILETFNCNPALNRDSCYLKSWEDNIVAIRRAISLLKEYKENFTSGYSKFLNRKGFVLTKEPYLEIPEMPTTFQNVKRVTRKKIRGSRYEIFALKKYLEDSLNQQAELEDIYPYRVPYFVEGNVAADLEVIVNDTENTIHPWYDHEINYDTNKDGLNSVVGDNEKFRLENLSFEGQEIGPGVAGAPESLRVDYNNTERDLQPWGYNDFIGRSVMRGPDGGAFYNNVYYDRYAVTGTERGCLEPFIGEDERDHFSRSNNRNFVDKNSFNSNVLGNDYRSDYYSLFGGYNYYYGAAEFRRFGSGFSTLGWTHSPLFTRTISPSSVSTVPVPVYYRGFTYTGLNEFGIWESEPYLEQVTTFNLPIIEADGRVFQKYTGVIDSQLRSFMPNYGSYAYYNNVRSGDGFFGGDIVANGINSQGLGWADFRAQSFNYCNAYPCGDYEDFLTLYRDQIPWFTNPFSSDNPITQAPSRFFQENQHYIRVEFEEPIGEESLSNFPKGFIRDAGTEYYLPYLVMLTPGPFGKQAANFTASVIGIDPFGFDVAVTRTDKFMETQRDSGYGPHLYPSRQVEDGDIDPSKRFMRSVASGNESFKSYQFLPDFHQDWPKQWHEYGLMDPRGSMSSPLLLAADATAAIRRNEWDPSVHSTLDAGNPLKSGDDRQRGHATQEGSFMANDVYSSDDVASYVYSGGSKSTLNDSGFVRGYLTKEWARVWEAYDGYDEISELWRYDVSGEYEYGVHDGGPNDLYNKNQTDYFDLLEKNFSLQFVVYARELSLGCRNDFECSNPDGPVPIPPAPEDEDEIFDIYQNCPAQYLRPDYAGEALDIGFGDFNPFSDEFLDFFSADFDPDLEEPSLLELEILEREIDECQLIEDRLGKDYLGCDYSNPKAVNSCGCPERGQKYSDYLKYVSTYATFWETPDQTPLRRNALMNQLETQKASITVAGDLNVRPGFVLNVDNPKSPEKEEAEYSQHRIAGKWFVTGIKHVMSSQSHVMSFNCNRDSNPQSVNVFRGPPKYS
jgi:hypothetical protein